MLAQKKEDCKFGMICPNLDVRAGFREVRKYEALVLPTLKQRRAQVLEKQAEPDFKISCTSTGVPLHSVLIICLFRGLQQFMQVSGKVLVLELQFK